MEYRNPVWDEDGIRIQCEVNHPVYGWIPFAADPADVEQHGRDIHAQILLDGGIGAYDVDLSDYKEFRKSEVNGERDVKLATLTIDLDGMTFDADADARENIVASVTAINAGVIPVPDPINWRDANNVTQSLSHLKLLELAGIMFAAIDAIYNESWTMKAAIDAAGDKAGVDAVDWS